MWNTLAALFEKVFRYNSAKIFFCYAFHLSLNCLQRFNSEKMKIPKLILNRRFSTAASSFAILIKNTICFYSQLKALSLWTLPSTATKMVLGQDEGILRVDCTPILNNAGNYWSSFVTDGFYEVSDQDWRLDMLIACCWNDFPFRFANPNSVHTSINN